MRLIDADARMQWLEDNTTEEEWMANQYNADWVYSMLETATTIDAVPVVRCYQCKYYAKSMVLCHHEDGLAAPDKMDFCSYGERKDGDG